MNDEDELEDEEYAAMPRKSGKRADVHGIGIRGLDGRTSVVEYLERRFGMEKKAFEDYGFYLGKKGRLHLGPKALPGHSKIVSVGLLVARVGDNGVIKPSTNLFQLFGSQVKLNFVSLAKENALHCMAGEDFFVSDAEVLPGSATDGYVLLRYLDFPLGCGLLKGRSIKNMLPKAKRLTVKYL